MTDERERMKRLQAAEMHEVHISPLPQITQHDEAHYSELKCGKHSILVFHRLERHVNKDRFPFALFDDVHSLRTTEDFEIAHALLQRAQSVMKGGV
jgi:hypothetical protein